MADETKIEWSDATLNLWFGCTQVSPACDHCYAMRWGPRLGVAWNGPPKRAADSAYDKINGYQRSAARFRAKHGRDRRVFINSLSDFFDNQAEDSWRALACVRMEAAPDVVFILVTKRPQNVARMVPGHWMKSGGWPPNIWLLTTAENQREFDRRVSHLLTLHTPKVLGISMEPMLEPITPGAAVSYSARERSQWVTLYTKKIVPEDAVNKLSWVIIGGESGPKARPMPPLLNVAMLMKLFASMGVAVFFKQLSSADAPGGAHKDYDRFPLALQERQHP